MSTSDKKRVIVTFGDSVTDSARFKEDPDHLGDGYTAIMAGLLGAEYPGKIKVYNRGCNGNGITSLYTRLYYDVILNKPDYLVILIGVNDCWNLLDNDGGEGTACGKFRDVYEMMIEEIRERLPETKIYLVEPFALDCGIPHGYGERFFREIESHSACVRDVAATYGTGLISVKEDFEQALKLADGEFWTLDGIHPDAPGSELIARRIIASIKPDLERDLANG